MTALIAARTRGWILRTLGAYTKDELLHRLAQDPAFDTRDTVPAPAPDVDTVRPAPHDKYAGALPHQVRGWEPR